MALPQEILDRILRPGQTIGLWLSENNQVVRKGLRILDIEHTYLGDFSLGAAAALSTNGTTWSSIQDSNNRYLLQPTQTGVLHQIFYGVSPGYIWLYRAYPANVIRGGLLLQAPAIGPTAGQNVGYRLGYDTPYRVPSGITETFVVNGLYPAYNGFHPWATPASVTVFMNFWIVKYNVVRTDDAPFREYTVGGSPPAPAPSWLSGPIISGEG